MFSSEFENVAKHLLQTAKLLTSTKGKYFCFHKLIVGEKKDF